MKRRGWTLIVGAILVSLLTWQALSMRVAYVALAPGDLYPTLGEAEYTDAEGELFAAQLVTADSEYATDSSGELLITTVSVIRDINLGQAIAYWISGDYAVAPRQLYYPDDKTEEEVREEQAQQWSNSQSAAETTALRELGHAVEVTVEEVAEDSPSRDGLEPGDVIVAADSEEVTSQLRLSELVAEADPGESIELDVERDGETETADARVESLDGVNVIEGVEVTPVQDDPYDLEVDDERLNVGGPSAGLIFTLAMIDRVDPEDLTGGMTLAGTGTIDEEGRVGPIGGIELKVKGAHAAGVEAMLVPSQNCEAAAAHAPDGLTLIEVGTVDDALDGLAALRDGGRPQTC